MIDNNLYKECINKISKNLQTIGFPTGRTILVAGATGLIGEVLIDALMTYNDSCHADNHVIACGRTPGTAEKKYGLYLQREDFSFWKWDINQPCSYAEDVDYIIHAASNTHPVAYRTDPIGTVTTNVIGTEHLLEYGVNHKCKRFVFLSSVEIYGEAQREDQDFTETDMGYIDCNTLRAGYPESKRCGEALCQAYAKQYGIELVIPRLCRIYGPTMLGTDSKAIAQFIKCAISKQDIILKSEGKQYYSYLDVFDAAYAILLLMHLGKNGEAYNVASEKHNKQMRDLAEYLAKLAGTKVVYQPPEQIEREGYSVVQRAVLDNSKLKGLGWDAEYTLEDALKILLDIVAE